MCSYVGARDNQVVKKEKQCPCNKYLRMRGRACSVKSIPSHGRRTCRLCPLRKETYNLPEGVVPAWSQHCRPVKNQARFHTE
jgi:hypothetical protein